ncbi:MAG: exodeoxyribonuclease III, partial [Gammaproteobacteria bacterium]
MLKVMTFNANGLRAAQRKGFFDWFATQDVDILCVQETKAQAEQMQDPVFHPAGYHVHFHDAEKKGYSGVAIYSRREPDTVTMGFGWPEFDSEGRFIRADYDGLAVISLYMPSGTTGDVRQEVKYKLMERFLPVLKSYAEDDEREYIICGDWNIAHKKIDIKNWKTNQKNSGFLPEERAWMDRVFG